MDRSARFGFYLPSRDTDDIADINQISDNFRIVDGKMVEKVDGKGLSTNDFTDEYKQKVVESYESTNELKNKNEFVGFTRVSPSVYNSEQLQGKLDETVQTINGRPSRVGDELLITVKDVPNKYEKTGFGTIHDGVEGIAITSEILSHDQLVDGEIYIGFMGVERSGTIHDGSTVVHDTPEGYIFCDDNTVYMYHVGANHHDHILMQPKADGMIVLCPPEEAGLGETTCTLTLYSERSEKWAKTKNNDNPWRFVGNADNLKPVYENINSMSKQIGSILEGSTGKSLSWRKLSDVSIESEANSVTLTSLDMPKCKEFIVRIVLPKSTTGSNIALGISYVYLNDPSSTAFRFTATTVNKDVVTEQRCKIMIADTLIYSDGTEVASGQSAVVAKQNLLVGNRFINADITSIICKLNDSSSTYKVGTKFSVYGRVEE